MKYSLINEVRSEAQPGLSGACPGCGHPMIAICGEVKIWHWRHKQKQLCDHWWENETDWHRNWKNCFPVDWQEVIQQDKNGERHIADVKTISGWVIEFQYSFIKPEERAARNAFYEKLVWVVNGEKSARYKAQFFKLLNESNPLSINPEMRKVYLDDCALLKEWSGIHAPVFFDFGEEILGCLLPAGQNMWGYVVAVHRREFIELHNKDADRTESFEDYLSKLNEFILFLQELSALQDSGQRYPAQKIRRSQRL